MEIKVVGDPASILGAEPIAHIKPNKFKKKKLPVGVTIVTRGPKASDVPFVLDSAIRSLSHQPIWTGWDKREVRQYLKNTLMRALTSGHFTMLIACSQEDEDEVVGYIVGNPQNNQILLQYTKGSYRELNVQKHSLMPFIVDMGKPIYMQFPTIAVMKLVREKRNTPGRVVVRDFMNEYAWSQIELLQQELANPQHSLKQEKAA